MTGCLCAHMAFSVLGHNTGQGNMGLAPDPRSSQDPQCSHL